MTADDPLRQLAKDYVVMVELFKAERTVEAQAVHDHIAGQLGAMAADRRGEAMASIFAGRPYDAIEHFGRVLEVHRWNRLKVDLGLSITDCLDEMAQLLAKLGQPVAAAAARTQALRGRDGRYKPSESCQIPILAGLYEHLFGAHQGTFVEVGAFDGETFSNTSCLADLGWRGLYIEPMPAAAGSCRQRHAANAAVEVLECAIGAHDGTVRFNVGGQFSTASSAGLERAQAHQWIAREGVQEIEVRQLTLDSALAQHGIAPGFELLVVDAEGMEVQVFEGCDLARWRPGHMIVELADENDAADTFGADARQVRERVRAAGYGVVYRDNCNTLFRREDGSL